MVKMGKTKCVTCAHSGVCKHEETMKAFAKSLEEVETPNIAEVIISCEKYLHISAANVR